MGYRIELSADPHDQTITVTAPQPGNTHHTYSFHPSALRDLPPGSMNVHSYPSLPHHVYSPHLQYMAHSPLPDSHFSPAVHNQQTTAAANYLGNLNGNRPAEKQPDDEFNHAIQFLNKIKSRYSEDANVYQQFLSILHMHQKEHRLSDVCYVSPSFH